MPAAKQWKYAVDEGSLAFQHHNNSAEIMPNRGTMGYEYFTSATLPISALNQAQRF